MGFLALVKTPRQESASQDEATLLRDAQAGDTQAFLRLMAAHRERVYGYLWRCGFDRMTRDDLAQEIFVKVHTGLPGYVPERPLRAWILAIAANTVRSHLRRRAHREPALGLVHEPASREPDAFMHASGNEMAQRLERAMAELPLAQREVVMLVCMEGLPQEDVAAALDMPLNTVKTNLRRARLRLAEALVRVDGSDE